MNNSSTLTVAIVFTTVILASSASLGAEGCDAYPLIDGMSAEETGIGPKIMSTSTVVVNFDDQGEVLDALKEAEMTAKAQIAKFFNEQISSDESINKAVETQIKIVGEQKSATKTELKKQLTSMRSSSQALLKGVMRLGDCYTKGKFVRVTVGVKPETTAAAISGQQMMQSTSAPKSNIQQSPSSGSTLNGVQGYSNSNNVSKF